MANINYKCYNIFENTNFQNVTVTQVYTNKLENSRGTKQASAITVSFVYSYLDTSKIHEIC